MSATLGIIRSEDRGGICPDCGYYMPPGEVNDHMNAHVQEQRAARMQQMPFGQFVIMTLTERGYHIMGTNIPMLFHVNGPGIIGAELTAMQLVDLMNLGDPA